MSGYPYIQPFMSSSSDRSSTSDSAILTERAQHKETLIKLGELYYTRCRDLQMEKNKRYPDAEKIKRLETIIIPNLEKWAPYAKQR